MKWRVILLILVVIGFGTLAADAKTEEHKTIICHATSSESNPWVTEDVDDSSLPAHYAHGDFLYQGAVDDKGKATDKNWCDNNAPVAEPCQWDKNLLADAPDCKAPVDPDPDPDPKTEPEPEPEPITDPCLTTRYCK